MLNFFKAAHPRAPNSPQAFDGKGKGKIEMPGKVSISSCGPIFYSVYLS